MAESDASPRASYAVRRSAFLHRVPAVASAIARRQAEDPTTPVAGSAQPYTLVSHSELTERRRAARQRPPRALPAARGDSGRDGGDGGGGGGDERSAEVPTPAPQGGADASAGTAVGGSSSAPDPVAAAWNRVRTLHAARAKTQVIIAAAPVSVKGDGEPDGSAAAVHEPWAPLDGHEEHRRHFGVAGSLFAHLSVRVHATKAAHEAKRAMRPAAAVSDHDAARSGEGGGKDEPNDATAGTAESADATDAADGADAAPREAIAGDADAATGGATDGDGDSDAGAAAAAAADAADADVDAGDSDADDAARVATADTAAPTPVDTPTPPGDAVEDEHDDFAVKGRLTSLNAEGFAEEAPASEATIDEGTRAQSPAPTATAAAGIAGAAGGGDASDGDDDDFMVKPRALPRSESKKAANSDATAAAADDDAANKSEADGKYGSDDESAPAKPASEVQDVTPASDGSDDDDDEAFTVKSTRLGALDVATAEDGPATSASKASTPSPIESDTAAENSAPPAGRSSSSGRTTHKVLSTSDSLAALLSATSGDGEAAGAGAGAGAGKIDESDSDSGSSDGDDDDEEVAVGITGPSRVPVRSTTSSEAKEPAAPEAPTYEPGHVFLQGWMTKKGHFWKTWKKRFFVLAQGTEMDDGSTYFPSIKYYDGEPDKGGQLKGTILLKPGSNVVESDEKKHGFVCRTAGNTTVFSCKDAATRDNWMEQITMVVGVSVDNVRRKRRK